MVRLKNRYLLLEILSPVPTHPTSTSAPVPPSLTFHAPLPSNLTPPLLLSALRASLVALYGDYGAGVTASSLSVKYLSPATSTAIVRASRAHYRLVWAAATMLEKLPGGRGCVFRVVRVSGTMRGVQTEVVRRGRLVVRSLGRESGEGPGVEGLGRGVDVDVDVDVDVRSGGSSEEDEGSEGS
ncbi:MAG: hypothetical protein M1832_000515 [Thelocarpon impressellum]|nr:MAG: hypothetical protein M1832_000515 [Thelocarpon impressellum]